MKKTIAGWVLGAWMLSAFGPAAAAADGDVTILVAPARYSVLQVLFDVLRLHPAVLVSYQGEPAAAEPFLNVWNGREWMYVSLADYRSGAFVGGVPGNVVLIGGPDVLPAVLKEAAPGGAPVLVESLDSASMLNALGHALHFGPSDWRWLAARYRMDLLDANEGKRRDSWYYGRWVEPAKPEAAPSAAPDVAAPPPNPPVPDDGGAEANGKDDLP